MHTAATAFDSNLGKAKQNMNIGKSGGMFVVPVNVYILNVFLIALQPKI